MHTNISLTCSVLALVFFLCMTEDFPEGKKSIFKGDIKNLSTFQTFKNIIVKIKHSPNFKNSVRTLSDAQSDPFVLNCHETTAFLIMHLEAYSLGKVWFTNLHAEHSFAVAL